jgi:predicted CopG family antitoxin
MGTKTISLEDSAYARLKAVKRPGESFSDVVNRVLGAKEPMFSDFKGILAPYAIKQLAETVEHMKREDIRLQRIRIQKR